MSQRGDSDGKRGCYDNANNTNGVTTLQTTTAVPGQSVTIGDLNNDGFVEIAMSGGTSPACACG